MTNRPSKKELFNKIRDAREAVADGRIEIAEAHIVAADAIELDYDIENDLKDILLKILETISPDHYKGLRPPDRSYKKQIKGLDLFAFVAAPSCFNCSVYLKFALAHNTFWLVSLHKDRPTRREE